jgi:hypothetical protein
VSAKVLAILVGGGPAPGHLIDARTGRFRVRHVDVASEGYQMLAAYMIRLTRADLANPEQVRALARAGGLDETALVTRFAGLVTLGRAAGP